MLAPTPLQRYSSSSSAGSAAMHPAKASGETGGRVSETGSCATHLNVGHASGDVLLANLADAISQLRGQFLNRRACNTVQYKLQT